ncbi:MAG TPA: IPT/TIG domain-containing protein [Polyangia bacterium]|nr:IPT/TIG domain-containing protein [Polyangia bacterium]
MRTPGRASLGVASLSAGALVLSCAGSTEPPVAVTGVMPVAAFNDATVSIVIEGGPFRPAYDIDTSGGATTAELGAFTAFLSRPGGGTDHVVPTSLTWLSTTELAAELPDGIARGTYDVEVRDPRGRLGTLASGFSSLGPDVTPPAVAIVEPVAGTIVNAQAEVPVAFTANDGLGYLLQLRWLVSSADVETQSGTCPFDPNAQQATCRFLFMVPPPQQAASALPLNVVVEAEDTAHNVGRAQITLAVGVTPVAKSLAPAQGPAVGGTLVSVVGANFIAGTQVFVGDQPLQPNGGTVMSPTLVKGTTVAQQPGVYPVTVQTGAASVQAGTFELIGRPQVLLVSPTMGPPAGGTHVAIVGKYFRAPTQGSTRILFGSDGTSAAALCCPIFVSQNRIEGLTPPGAGASTIFAEDAIAGVGQLPLAFNYVSQDDAGAEMPTGCHCADGGAP